MATENAISETVEHMRDRIARCRRLARATDDDQTAAELTAMADEIEADLKRLSEEQARSAQA